MRVTVVVVEGADFGGATLVALLSSGRSDRVRVRSRLHAVAADASSDEPASPSGFASPARDGWFTGGRVCNGEARMAALPAGTVTFLFTDLEGSTRLWEAH